MTIREQLRDAAMYLGLFVVAGAPLFILGDIWAK
jgi:hypothetical protein